jgi:cell division protease FtsH
MPALPSVLPFAGLLADLSIALRQASCCLVVCDKGWTLPLYRDLRDRLHADGMSCEYLDGRRSGGDPGREDVGVMLITIAQLRRAVRRPEEPAVVVLPHLDVMAALEAGWTTIARELVPLLYENPTAIVLGFQDPTVPLLPVVLKLFHRRYTVDQPFRVCADAPPPAPNDA